MPCHRKCSFQEHDTAEMLDAANEDNLMEGGVRLLHVDALMTTFLVLAEVSLVVLTVNWSCHAQIHFNVSDMSTLYKHAKQQKEEDSNRRFAYGSIHFRPISAPQTCAPGEFL